VCERLEYRRQNAGEGKKQQLRMIDSYGTVCLKAVGSTDKGSKKGSKAGV
jgi:hypothetical protein